MTGVDVLHPHGNGFDPFLQAAVGEDRNGQVVTVLSMLARLGLDPWSEASGLASLSRAAAGTRLDKLLSGFRDVPALGLDHGAIARSLTDLLPVRSQPSAPKAIGSSASLGPTIVRRADSRRFPCPSGPRAGLPIWRLGSGAVTVVEPKGIARSRDGAP